MSQLIIQHLKSERNDGAISNMEHKIERDCRNGFTLIELLVVIIIIAILAAIIYPVFSSVRENNRQSTSISNMHDISTKLAEFELDKHEVPQVLFGYAGTVPMDQALANSTNPAYQFPGLYPAYIDNVNEFIDPNNESDLKTTTPAVVNVLCPSSLSSSCTAGSTSLEPVNQNPVTLAAWTPNYYTADSYDISPQIAGPNTFVTSAGGAFTYVPRYQAAWTQVTSGGTPPSPSGWSVYPTPGDTDQAIYDRQLHWQFPPSDTYVTSTTYHVPKSNTVLALYENGSVKKFTADQFTLRDGGVDPGAISPPNGNGVATANFWQDLPTD